LPERRKQRLAVAIVGSRHCSDYGASVAYSLAKSLAERDVIVVSGMAYGIDSYAHQGCLDGDGQTVAVLGTPINRLYPSMNKNLAKAIVDNGGAIISEFAPGAETYRQSFLHRNRIVSGLSDALVIIEASERSGTLATAKYASDQGRSVFAVPGDIGRETSLGTNRLIMDGVGVFTNVDDMLDSIYSRWRHCAKLKCKKQYEGDFARIIKELSLMRMTTDALSMKLGLSVRELGIKLSILELEGAIKSDSAGSWSLVL